MIRLALLGIAVRLLMSIILEGAKLWLLVKPYKRIRNAIRQRRTRKAMQSWDAEHGGPPDEILETFNQQPDEGRTMGLDLGTRTSTNTVVGTGFLGTAYVQLVGLLPYPDLVAALTTPQMVVVVTAVIAWVVARISKTPANPGAL